MSVYIMNSLAILVEYSSGVGAFMRMSMCFGMREVWI